MPRQELKPRFHVRRSLNRTDNMEHLMSDDPTKKGRQDWTRINLSQDHELRYWSEKFGVTVADLREAVKKVGNSAAAVEKELAG